MDLEGSVNSRGTTVTEIIGPAGVGKSTLSTMLNARCPQINAGITIWRLSRMLLARSLFLSVPTIVQTTLVKRELNHHEIKEIVRLEAFSRHLGSADKKRFAVPERDISPIALFVDEGIIFSIGKMCFERGDSSFSLCGWEQQVLDRASELIDNIVWLDAPDEVLIRRIRVRRKAHRMKFKADAEIGTFLAKYRRSYEFVVTRIKRKRDIKVVRFDTSLTSLDDIAEELSHSTRSTERQEHFDGDAKYEVGH